MGAPASFELLPHQAKVARALELRKETVCMVGGLGSAKTTTHYVASMLRAGQTPGGRQLLVMPTAGMLTDVVIPTFEAWIDEHRVWHRWRKPEGRTNLYVRVAGEWAEIRFRSGDVPGRLDGGEYCHVGGDEWGQAKEATHKKLRARARGYDYCSKLFTGSPEGTSGSFYDEAEGDRKPGTVCIRAKTDDNKHLKPSPEAYIAELVKGFSPEELEGYRFGRFVPLGGRAYWAFDRKRHVVPYAGNLTAGRLVMGCDFGVTPMHWVLGVVVGAGDKLRIHIIDEVVRENTWTGDHAELAADYWITWLMSPLHTPTRRQVAQQVTAYTDAAGRARTSKAAENDFAHMQRVGFTVRAPDANPSVRDSAYALNFLLHVGRLLIDPRCEHTIHCLENQGKDKYGEPDKTKGLDHGTDSCRYLVWGVAPSVRPTGNRPAQSTYR